MLESVQRVYNKVVVRKEMVVVVEKASILCKLSKKRKSKKKVD